MNEHSFRLYQVIFQTIAAIGAVIVFFVGIHRWHADQNALLEKRIEAEETARDREFRRELWMRQVDVLAEIADTASRLAALVDVGQPEEFDEVVLDLERLYWGNVTFVVDQELVDSMRDLRDQIRYLREGLGGAPNGGPSRRQKLKQHAYDVATVCRNVIVKSGQDYVKLLQDGSESVSTTGAVQP